MRKLQQHAGRACRTCLKYKKLYIESYIYAHRYYRLVANVLYFQVKAARTF